MPLQSLDLTMLTLGIVGDTPPNSLQPPLDDGMHLRWSFRPAKGFPWYGYYLFRRPARKRQKGLCISRDLAQYRPGSLGASHLTLGFGHISSDEPLVFTEDFPPSGSIELDLANRSYIRYSPPPGEVIHWAEATIGFRRRDESGSGKRFCIDFREDDTGQVRNPLTRDEVSLLAHDHTGAPLSQGRLVQISGYVGWDTGYEAEIKLPCPASKVLLLLVHGSREPKVVALDGAGKQVDESTMTGRGPEALTLTGDDIQTLRVEASQDEAAILKLCWVCGSQEERALPGADEICIPVEARWQGTLVDDKTVCGSPGQIKKVQLSADLIDGIEFGAGPAALIDLCVVTVRETARGGWEPIKGFEYPLCLPVAHGDYPCPGAPTSVTQARSRALARVAYGPSGPWGGARFDELHGRLRRLVVNGPPPGGLHMVDRFEPVAGTPAPPPEAGGSIVQQRQRPLELALLGSLHPAVAQMLGIYWNDESANPGESYDYLLVADHNDSLGGTVASALHWLQTVFDFSVVDGYIAYNRVVGPAQPLTPPASPRAYSLPGSTVRPDGGGAVIDATNNAGLTWDRPVIQDYLSSRAAILYHVWRADLGNTESPPDPTDGDFAPLTRDRPIPVSTSITTPPQVPEMPDQWPPFVLQYIDRGRTDGWYAYGISGIDIFGRHSARSDAAQWYQWAPTPSPRPWYYLLPEADREIHSSRIRLLDKIPPPPPRGVEAFALDPQDPHVLKDGAWQTWWDSLSTSEKSSVIGLRVRWQWGREQQRQAPDTREFRVYYHPAPLNTLRGRVTAVSPASSSETDVTTDIANTQPAGSYAGHSARIGAESFVILSSEAGTPLRFRVRNIGASDDVRPATRTRCAIPLTSSHALSKDFSSPGVWNDRLLVVPYSSPVLIDGSERYYEAFLPIPGAPDRDGLPLVTSLVEPIAGAVIGVTAADDKQHTLDTRGEADRYGNESDIGGPATVLRVRRTVPAAPASPPDSARLWASAADYNSRSFFTYRWLPETNLKTFVYRALDDAVFQADRAQRPRTALHESDAEFFPDPSVEPTWDAAKRQQVADELNALNAVDPTDPAAVRNAYQGLSNDGMRVLAGLPGTDRVFVQLTHLPLDPDETESGAPDGLRWRRVGPDVDVGSLTGDQRAYVDTLDGRASNRYFYRCAYVDEVQNIGSMGISSPPVYLPDVTPPAAPRIARLSAGDRQITLEWASNREADLAEYRIYRTQVQRSARDVRHMDLVHSVAVAEGDPATRPRKLSWTDSPVQGLTDTWYRLVAVDRVSTDPKGGGGNISRPSPAMRGRAFDQTPPIPPMFTLIRWILLDETGAVHDWGETAPAGETWEAAVELGWSPAADGVRLLVQAREESDVGFTAASPWLESGTSTYIHRNTRSFATHEYRLKAISAAGNANVVYHPSTLEPPA